MKPNIKWSIDVLNCVTGCSYSSHGCGRCYAEIFTRRLKGVDNKRTLSGLEEVTLHPERLNQPRQWRKPKLVFVNSVIDTFHDDVSESFIHEIFAMMEGNPMHTFILLTKQAERLVTLAPEFHWPPNLWIGVTVEHEGHKGRIDLLRTVPAALRFLSIEPLLSPMENLDLSGIGWVIVGGETGRTSRPVPREWVVDLRDQCLAAEVPFFFKQWGGTNKKANGCLLDGRTWNEMPPVRPDAPKVSV